MKTISRRSLLLSGAGAAAALSPAARALATAPRYSWDVVVVGAGVFGAWTAKKLQEAGQLVLWSTPGAPPTAAPPRAGNRG